MKGSTAQALKILINLGFQPLLSMTSQLPLFWNEIIQDEFSTGTEFRINYPLRVKRFSFIINRVHCFHPLACP